MTRKAIKDAGVFTIYKTVGRNVRRLRGDMSQKKLSEKAKVSRSTVESIENGFGCSFENLIKIARALGVSPADLFITDEQRKEVTYSHLLLMEKVRETLTGK